MMTIYTAGERIRIGEALVARDGKLYRARTMQGVDEVVGVARDPIDEGAECYVDDGGHVRLRRGDT